MSLGAAARAADKFGDISMKRILGGMVVAAALSGSAFAADLPPRGMYAKAPPMAPPPVSNWTGWYVGGNVGYGWGSGTMNTTMLPGESNFNTRNGSVDVKSQGVIGGA